MNKCQAEVIANSTETNPFSYIVKDRARLVCSLSLFHLVPSFRRNLLKTRKWDGTVPTNLPPCSDDAVLQARTYIYLCEHKDSYSNPTNSVSLTLLAPQWTHISYTTAWKQHLCPRTRSKPLQEQPSEQVVFQHSESFLLLMQYTQHQLC